MAREVFGVAQARAFIAQVIGFADLQVGGADFLDLEGEHVDALDTLALVLAQGGHLFLHLLQAANFFGHRFALFFQSGEGI